MPGAQDRWDQLTEPSVRSQEATPPDRSRLADRPERGSLADLRQRLERLPAGHPSSPYNDDLTRKLPVTSLKDLELPLQGTERDLNGTAKHYEHGLAEGASHNGVGGRGLDADTLSTSGWTSVTDVEDAADALDDADGVSAPEDLGAPAGDRTTPEDLGAPAGDRTTPEDLGAPAGDRATPDDLSTTNGLGGTDGLAVTDPADGEGDTGTDEGKGVTDWLSAPWGSPADLGSTASEGITDDWDSAPGRDAPANLGPDGATEPGWAEPEPAVGTLSHGVLDTEPNHASEEPRTGPDGSWEWNGRHLTPEQRLVAENALSRYRVAEGRNVFGSYGHSGLTPAMRRVEAQLERGQMLPDTEDRALKSPDRFKERLADLIARHPDKSAEELSDEVHDGIRYAFIFETEHYAEGTLQVHSRLKGNGFELEARWNGWESREYKGINSRWRDPAHDLVFEVQFHTASSWDVWQQAHASYKQIIDPRTSPAERMRLRAVHAEKSAVISVPPGCTAIPDFRKEGQ
jgi:hypothetical protein